MNSRIRNFLETVTDANTEPACLAELAFDILKDYPENERTRRIRTMAKEQYHKDGKVEIDSDAAISESGPGGDNGAYVSAWVWVSFAGTPFSKETGNAQN